MNVSSFIVEMYSVFLAPEMAFSQKFWAGAFSLSGKMPESDSYFFLQTTNLTLIGSLITETTKTTQAKSGQCKLSLSTKGPPLHFYFFNVTYETGRD